MEERAPDVLDFLVAMAIPKLTLLGVCMWKTMWKMCEKCPVFTLISHVFHTFFTHFSHAFHTHISHACEILHSEIYVKRVWNDVNPFTHIFTYTSHGVSHRLSHVNPHLNSHIFSYTSHGVSHRLSHVLNPHWMAKHPVIHTLFHIHFTWGFTWAFTCKASVIRDHQWLWNFTTLQA